MNAIFNDPASARPASGTKALNCCGKPLTYWQYSEPYRFISKKRAYCLLVHVLLLFLKLSNRRFRLDFKRKIDPMKPLIGKQWKIYYTLV
jgi:hypothetical protein